MTFVKSTASNSSEPSQSSSPGASGSPAEKLKGKRAAILLYSGYPDDPRPRRAADAMVAAGMSVDLFCVDDAGTKPKLQSIGGLNIHRVRMNRDRGNKLSYVWKYARFLLSAFFFLARKGMRTRYHVVHVHNMPDILVFSALLPKMQGARIVLDLHDPMPELMMSIYGLGPDSKLVRLLLLFEKLSIRFSNVVLTPNITFKELFISRGCPREKMKIVMNSPEIAIFNPERMPADRKRPEGSFRLIHHGSIVHRHGIDLLVEAVALVRDKIPGIRLDFYGLHTPFVETIMEVVRKRGLAEQVFYRGPAHQPVIAEEIHNSDLGIIPNRRSSFTELNFPTRIFEYLAMNRPLIAPATKGIKDYFTSEDLIMFEPDNIEDLAARILWAYENRDALPGYVERGRKVYLRNLWPDEKSRFLTYVAGTAW